jgi:hypothetical protein
MLPHIYTAHICNNIKKRKTFEACLYKLIIILTNFTGFIDILTTCVIQPSLNNEAIRHQTRNLKKRMGTIFTT